MEVTRYLNAQTGKFRAMRLVGFLDFLTERIDLRAIIDFGTGQSASPIHKSPRTLASRRECGILRGEFATR